MACRMVERMPSGWSPSTNSGDSMTTAISSWLHHQEGPCHGLSSHSLPRDLLSTHRVLHGPRPSRTGSPISAAWALLATLRHVRNARRCLCRFSAGEVSATDDAGSGGRIVEGRLRFKEKSTPFRTAVDLRRPRKLTAWSGGRLRRELLVVASVMPVRCQRRLAPRVTPCQTVSVERDPYAAAGGN